MDRQMIREFRRTMRMLERALDEQLQEGVQCCGVTLVQCHTLMELDRRDEMNLTELSGVLELDKSTVSRGIDVLVKNGLVDRRADENNRRSVILTLTASGKRACAGINEFCDGYYLEIFNRITPDKHEMVVSGLAEFAGAITAVKKEHPIRCADTACGTTKKKEEK